MTRLKLRQLIAMGVLGGNSVPYSIFDSFARGDGALGNTESLDADGRSAQVLPWTGATWSIVSQRAGNVPTLGGDLWDANASTFEGTSTYAWTALGTNTIANVSNTLAITYVNNAGGAQCRFRNTADLSSDLTVNQWYLFTCTATMNTGTARLAVYDGTTDNYYSAFATTTPSTLRVLFKARSATAAFVTCNLLSTGEVMTIDNLSLKPVTLATLFATIPITKSDFCVAAKVQQTGGSLPGPVARLDSASNPLNYIRAYHNGFTTGNNGRLRIDKVLNGVSTTALNVAVNYSDDAEIAMDISGTTVTLYYGGVQQGDPVTIDDAAINNNTLVGMFSDQPGTLDNFKIYDGGYVAPPIIAALGDSITSSGQWFNQIAASWRKRDNRILNVAMAASNIMNTNEYGMAYQVAQVSGASMIFILTGTNEIDETDACRAKYQEQLGLLQTQNPDATIFPMGVLDRTNNNAQGLTISNLIQTACNNAGVGFYSMRNVIVPATDTIDGLHPNDGGYTKIVTKVKTFSPEFV